MKKCTQCDILKETTEFYFRKGLPISKCKACHIKIVNIWRKSNKEKDKKYKQSRSNKLKMEIDLLKSKTPCKDCRKFFPPYCMEYDHLQDKNYSISRMVTNGLSINSVLKEIEKTELVCILCHRNRTYSRLDSNKYSSFRKKKIELIWSLKNYPCSNCGIKYDPWQMDFNHLDPDQKLHNVAQMISHSEDKILKEIAKCNILCALCHRMKSLSTLYLTKS